MGDVLIVERKEDMSPNGYLRLLMEPDGDIIVHVGECDPNGEFTQFADVQFCTLFGGGGRSPKTHAALRELMLAMARRDGGETKIAGINERADAICGYRFVDEHGHSYLANGLFFIGDIGAAPRPAAAAGVGNDLNKLAGCGVRRNNYEQF